MYLLTNKIGLDMTAITCNLSSIGSLFLRTNFKSFYIFKII